MRWLPWTLIACGTDFSGTYTIDSAEFTTNDCLDDGSMLPANTIEVVDDGSSLEIELFDGATPLSCERSGRSFTCPAVEIASDTQGTARLSTVLATQGTLGKTLEATRTGSTTCQGGDCATIESISEISYPCAMAFEFTASP